MKNMVERAVWTGIQSGLALVVTADFVGIEADLSQTLIIAGVATLLSALKTFSEDRLGVLNAKHGRHK